MLQHIPMLTLAFDTSGNTTQDFGWGDLQPLGYRSHKHFPVWIFQVGYLETFLSLLTIVTPAAGF
jgi:hypothetical protein